MPRIATPARARCPGSPGADRRGRSHITYSPYRVIAVRLGESAENVLAGQPGSFCVFAGFRAGPPARFRAAQGVALHFPPILLAANRRSAESGGRLCSFMAGRGRVLAGDAEVTYVADLPVSRVQTVPGRPRCPVAARSVRAAPRARRREVPAGRTRVARPDPSPCVRIPGCVEVAPSPVARWRLLVCHVAHYNIVERYAAVWRLPMRVLGVIAASARGAKVACAQAGGGVAASGMSSSGMPCSIQAGSTNYLE
ncbi:hypothetical protein SAMN05443665_105612 [Actinomadura meyerae]|jgi:hypothetical protein|uniref:Uncharacterized protein n=1 Tax=Actinomadura meyerae TaxID=240840 RepID=A0A239NZN6_9ACTN|nr:hypothetical protein SAMN05443665_105612 [Actinomadura meyerae]